MKFAEKTYEWIQQCFPLSRQRSTLMMQMLANVQITWKKWFQSSLYSLEQNSLMKIDIYKTLKKKDINLFLTVWRENDNYLCKGKLFLKKILVCSFLNNSYTAGFLCLSMPNKIKSGKNIRKIIISSVRRSGPELQQTVVKNMGRKSKTFKINSAKYRGNVWVH